MKLSAFIRNATGTRRRVTSAGSCFSHVSRIGSKALQCGHAYEKNSITSIFPGATPGGCGVSRRVKSLPSTGAAAGCANAGALGASAAPAMPAARRVREKWRRFMFVFMGKATVEERFAPTRQVPARRREACRRRRAAGSSRLHLDADRRDRTARLEEALLQVRHDLAQLGRH